MTIEFLAFDTETAVSSPEDRLVEIGAVRVRDGALVEEFRTFVDPECAISRRGTWIHGISNEDVCGAPKAGEAIRRFLAFAGNSMIFAHNASFDSGIMRRETKRCCVEWTAQPVRDSLRLFRRHWPGLPSYSLGRLIEYFGIEGTRHRALDDSRHLAILLSRCIAEHGPVVLEDCRLYDPRA